MLSQRGTAGSNVGTAAEAVVAMDLLHMKGMVSKEVEVLVVESVRKEKPPDGFSRINEKRRMADGRIRGWQYSGIGSGTLYDTQEFTPLLVEHMEGLIAKPVSTPTADNGEPFDPLVSRSRKLRRQMKEEADTLRSASTSGAPLRQSRLGKGLGFRETLKP